VTELHEMFLAAGLKGPRFYAKTKQVWFRIPISFVRAVERLLEAVPSSRRRRLANRWPLRQLLNGAVVACKAA
jgi:hypothetical protein